MRLVVDLTLCQGYAQCCYLAPEAFTLVGEEALMYNPEPDPSLRTRVTRAVAACPLQAIHAELEPDLQGSES
jgi:ferredoxin